MAQQITWIDGRSSTCGGPPQTLIFRFSQAQKESPQKGCWKQVQKRFCGFYEQISKLSQTQKESPQKGCWKQVQKKILWLLWADFQTYSNKNHTLQDWTLVSCENLTSCTWTKDGNSLQKLWKAQSF